MNNDPRRNVPCAAGNVHRAGVLLSRAMCLLLTAAVAGMAWGRDAGTGKAPAPAARLALEAGGRAEARLIEIYRMIGRNNSHEVLEKARTLVRDYPNFQLGHLIYGDLLTGHGRPLQALGQVSAELAGDSPRLQELRDESRLRLLALRERPAAGAVPAAFVSLAARTRHAVAVDVSRARLYLFENSGNGLRLIADYYVSVGKAGVGKRIESDLRTPLGVYFITSSLDPKALPDLYGAGALPINYPNALDNRRGRSGSGIWLHGTPSAQFARAPLATEGCVAIANPDLQRIMQTVEIRTTPVVIAQRLDWVRPEALQQERKAADSRMQAWAQARSSGDERQFMRFYAPDFQADDKVRALHAALKQKAAPAGAGRLSELSVFRWTDQVDVMITNFGDLLPGEKRGRVVRQYWERRQGEWKIVYEGVVG